MADIGSRKADHIDLAAHGDVGFKQTTTLLECVRLVHDALPELDLDAVDLSVEVLGKRLAAPILIAGMTGGTDRAADINRQLAALAEERGYAFGLGSQRPMLRDAAQRATYAVRDVAPSVLLLGNLGVVQARELPSQAVTELAQAVEADAVCIHLNPAMELVQPEGDRDFRGGLETLERLAVDCPLPIIAKETGCGLSRGVAQRLRQVGVEHVDVSGAGGTSWVAVETQRSASGQRALGEAFWEWGIPTAVSVAWVAEAGFRTVFATGGVKTGLDIARALALGATAGGIARPVLQALTRGGVEEAKSYLLQVERELKAAMLLVGAADVASLRRAPRVLLGELQAWLSGAR